MRKCPMYVATIVGLCFIVCGVRAEEDAFTRAALEFLASPDGNAPSNAVSHYILAMMHFTTDEYFQYRDGFNKILSEGFTGKETEEIARLRALEPILTQLSWGSEKPLVKYPPYESAPSSWLAKFLPAEMSAKPFPNLLKLRLLGNLLIIRALYSEFEKQPQEAVEWFKHALLFAQRMCDENSPLLVKLFSIETEALALSNLEQFMVRQNLSQDTYLTIADYLTSMSRTRIPLWQCIVNESRADIRLIPEVKPTTPTQSLSKEEEATRAFVLANKEALVKQYAEYIPDLERWLKKPCADIWRTDPPGRTGFAALTAQRPLMAKLSLHYPEIYAKRECIVLADWDLSIATAEILAYRAAKGAMPARLSDLAAMGRGTPNDPFSGQPLKYVITGNESLLYSVGPDTADNRGRIPYDPTNGTISPGDLICTFPKAR